MNDPQYQPKDALFEEVMVYPEGEGTGATIRGRKFLCKLCSRTLSTKHRVLTHLHTAHRRSPVKRIKKLYKSDPNLPIPKRTLYFWKAGAARKPKEVESSTSVGNENHQSPVHDVCDEDDQNPKTSGQVEEDRGSILGNGTEEDDADIAIGGSCPEHSNLDSELSDDESDSETDSEPSISTESSSHDSNESSDSSDSEEELQSEGKEGNKFTKVQLQSMSLLAFVLRHSLTGVAANDMLGLHKVLCPDSTAWGSMKYEELIQLLGTDVHHKMCHYCPRCESVFPEDPDVYLCGTPTCGGLRYKGGPSAQSSSNRQPCHFFVIADVKSQLKHLLERNGILEKISQIKTKAKVANCSSSSPISDVTDGKYYRNLLKDGEFLADADCISGIFNSDGIPLYKSAQVKLWPIFLAINEIPLSERFSRDNMILVGIWQGKGNPPFLQYMNAFGEEMCHLYYNGITVETCASTGNVPERRTIKLGVMLGVVDLQAKGYILNMTMHNGESGCCTCEEPGKSVKQGKGHARCYPYRANKTRYAFRDSDQVKYQIGPKATSQKRIKGIRGLTGLASMPWFDVVLGIVPDYMHGVLMGVTKTLMNQWFSHSQSKKPYFIGKHLSGISKRLLHIKPPDYVERLPRDLEKHYAHLKATELQAWLLYYALPCLTGYLPAVYLQHFACLSKAVHLLLSDCITEPDLERAEKLLDSFYQDFSNLYGEGSCGLNVHNIGAHLVFYVRLWGPLFAWSCFGFEDWNAALLQSVHGTKDVTRQILYCNQAQLQIKSSYESMPSSAEKMYISKMIHLSKQWKVVAVAQDCTISGAVTTCNLNGVPANQTQQILDAIGVQEMSELKKVLRIKYRKEKLYSSEYKRMKKRICYVVLTKDGQIVAIKYFIYKGNSNAVFAVAQVINLKNDCFMFNEAGRHVLRVVESDDIVVIPIVDIKEKVLFVSVCKSQSFVCQICMGMAF